MTIVFSILLVVVLMMLMGVPVGFAFGLGGFGILFFTGIDPRFAMPAAFRSIESYTLMALPLFILAGGLISESGISRRLLNFIMSIVGRTKGGLGVVCVVTCTIFGAISGSASGAIAAIGSIMIPEMTKQGYPSGYFLHAGVAHSPQYSHDCLCHDRPDFNSVSFFEYPDSRAFNDDQL